MPSYMIVPKDRSGPQAVEAADASAVFRIIGGLTCREADVLADDAYAFSVRLADNGIWTIYNSYSDIRRDDMSAWG